ncbi:DUF2490 domain-containing protein [Mucilaginibacter sp. S1162]|uniref:DUF2490 domain-containing protein n=1 Tax=Mucilaginibacter humi TaxID=2732510 RepID=A0ABX1W1E8_9SPHI|nr:DUF2490 domain-containing protein [Mucilaginibacter humi]NNU34046.1 DUF2490 domain-containing protein [Mucilaginibacter humi]
MHISYLNFIRIFICSAIFLIGYVKTATAQTNELSGWAAWFHTQRFSKHWGASFDGQFRSAHHADYLKNVLLRPNLNYYFGGNKSATLGYAYVSANGRTATGGKTFRSENRIFEQFIISQKAGINTAITHRFRLEQRFLGATPTQQEVFSQRVRYFIRGVIPFNNEPTFTKGTFLALQNEVFANIQNNDKINNHVFDQNRAYVALGYRFSNRMDIDAGYLNQYVQQTSAHTINHIAQIALYTRFGK